MANDLTIIPLQDICTMASAISASKLFGMKTKEEALALMLVAQSEGLHPARAAMEYHIIQGRPSLKADAMLARFQHAGGKVEWHSYTDDCCEATISHPQGGSVKIKWDMARVKKAQIKNSDMYSKYPRNMLRSRVISEGIKTVFPGVAVGMYTEEEVDSFAPKEKAITIEGTVTQASTGDDDAKPAKHEPPKGTVGLTEWAKKYAQDIGMADTSEQLEALVRNNARDLGALASALPPWHARIVELLNQKRQLLDMPSAAGQEVLPPENEGE